MSVRLEKSKDSIYPIPFNPYLLPEPFGFANGGNTCYWNALFQALLTCTSLRELIEGHRDDEKFISNPIITELLSIYDGLESSGISNRACELWDVTQKYRESQGKPTFTRGSQQDANEMFMYLTGMLEDNPSIMRLFMHAYHVIFFCHKECNMWTSKVKQVEICFFVDPSFTTPQIAELSMLPKKIVKEGNLSSYIYHRRGYVDKDTRCPKCQTLGPFLQEYRLFTLPGILMVVSKNYFKNENADFPPVVHIPARNPADAPPSEKRLLRYEAIAQIQHSGSMSGGHYWAICKRKGGWWNLNDTSVTKAGDEFSPNANTYCVIYHYVGNEVICPN
jgi:ubiquitin C-terminal hydrolase